MKNKYFPDLAPRIGSKPKTDAVLIAGISLMIVVCFAVYVVVSFIDVVSI